MRAEAVKNLHLTKAQLSVVHNVLQDVVPDFDVYAFGSRVTGKHLREFSDLDVAVMTDAPLSLRRVAALKEAFSQSNLPFKVDVVDWASLDERFRNIIMADCIKIHPAPGA